MSQQPLDHFGEEDSDLYRHLSSVDGFGGRPVTIIILLEDPKYRFLEIIDDWLPRKYSNTEYTVKKYENHTVVDLDLNLEDETNKVECPHCHHEISKEELLDSKEDNKLSLVFSNDDNPVFYLITNKKSQEIRNKVLDFFNSFYPIVSRVGYRSSDLKNILVSLSNDYSVKINDYVAERRYGDKTTIREHPQEMKAEEAFSKARDSETWIDNLECEIAGRRTRLSRDGRIQLYKDYRTKDAVKEIIEPLIEVSVEEFRQIKKLKEQESDPKLTYETAEKVFTEEVGANKIIESINSLDKFEVGRISIQKEKPELMIKDYKSGTSYLLNVVGEDKLIIFPQEDLRVMSLYKLLHEVSSLYEGRYTND